ncbi:hypothetical protein MRX96_042309 [Rhipicephalus microplus]
MGAAAEAALRCSTVVHAVLQRLPVEDLFLSARYDDLWEHVATTLLRRKLSFFALLQDGNVGRATPEERQLVAELRWRLGLVERACRRPASAILFSCCDKSYEARAVASCFPRRGAASRRGARRASACWCCSRGPAPNISASGSHASEITWWRTPEPHRQPRETWRRSSTSNVGVAPVVRGKSRTVTRGRASQPRFALYASSVFNQRTFRRPPSLYHVPTCVLGTTRVRVLKHSTGSRYGVPICWGTTLFGSKTKATSVKYRGSATDVQVSRHLSGVRREFGSVRDSLVLLFQEDALNAPATEVIWSVFRNAATVLGMAVNSLALDVNRVAFHLDPASDAESSKCLETPVVVAVLRI